MKTWLLKWRISGALDQRKPLPPDLAQAVAKSGELRRFVDQATELEQALHDPKPAAAVSPSAHAAIMRAVRSARAAPAWDWHSFRPFVQPAAALVFATAVGIFVSSHYFQPPDLVSPSSAVSSLALATDALDTSDTFLRTIPDTALSPLSDEMQKLTDDVTGAQNFLAASLP